MNLERKKKLLKWLKRNRAWLKKDLGDPTAAGSGYQALAKDIRAAGLYSPNTNLIDIAAYLPRVVLEARQAAFVR